jgi:membrane protein
MMNVMKPVKKLWSLIASGDLQVVASSLSFTTILSIVPFFAVALSLISSLQGLELLYPKVEGFILSYFQGPAGADGVWIVKRAFNKIQQGKIGSWGAVGLVLTSLLLVSEVDNAINRIWNLQGRRPLHKRLFLYWILLMAFPFILALMVALISVKSSLPALASVSSGTLQMIVLSAVLFCLYKVIPHTKVSALSAFMGTFVGLGGLFLVTGSFQYLTEKFFNYNKLYGSIAAIPALLVWILLIWYVILFGAAVSASFHRK